MVLKLLDAIFKLRTSVQLRRYRNFCNIGEGTIFLRSFGLRFDQQPELRQYISLGQRCTLGCKVVFEAKTGKVDIGNNVHIGKSTLICRSAITIGNDVTIAWGVTIYDHDSHSLYWEDRKYDNENIYLSIKEGGFNEKHDWSKVPTAPIVVGDRVWIGFDALILKPNHQ